MFTFDFLINRCVDCPNVSDFMLCTLYDILCVLNSCFDLGLLVSLYGLGTKKVLDAASIN